MKNLKNRLSYALTIMVTVLFISCSVEDGAMGPAGANGKDGINGNDGNANVTTVLIEKIGIKKDEHKTFTVNAITQDILDNGAVLAYLRSPSTPAVYWPLPYLYGTDRMNVFRLKLNEIQIFSSFDNTVYGIKLLIIAGDNPKGASGRAYISPDNNILSSLMDSGIDINDYEQVAAYYNIED